MAFRQRTSANAVFWQSLDIEMDVWHHEVTLCGGYDWELLSQISLLPRQYTMAKDVLMDGVDGAGVHLNKLEPLLQEIRTETQRLPGTCREALAPGPY